MGAPVSRRSCSIRPLDTCRPLQRSGPQYTGPSHRPKPRGRACCPVRFRSARARWPDACALRWVAAERTECQRADGPGRPPARSPPANVLPLIHRVWSGQPHMCERRYVGNGCGGSRRLHLWRSRPRRRRPRTGQQESTQQGQRRRPQLIDKHATEHFRPYTNLRRAPARAARVQPRRPGSARHASSEPPRSRTCARFSMPA